MKSPIVIALRNTIYGIHGIASVNYPGRGGGLNFWFPGQHGSGDEEFLGGELELRLGSGLEL
jgi:hypothetical protein